MRDNSPGIHRKRSENIQLHEKRCEPTARLARNGPIRMLRLAQVIDVTGLGKIKIYELQAEGDFPHFFHIAVGSIVMADGGYSVQVK